MYNVIYRRMFSCNYLSVPTYKFYFKILFKKLQTGREERGMKKEYKQKVEYSLLV
jgi:hypothetical protein